MLQFVAPDEYRFGPFEVRARTRELYKHGTRLKLRPQPFLVLQLLLQRAGDVVTREELQQALWPEDTFVDFEHGLNTSMKELRRALSDSPSAPRYIETLPKLGYRLIAAIETEQPAASAVLPQIPVLVPERHPLRPALTLAAVLLLAAAVIGGSWGWQRVRAHSQAGAGRLMLAVLPFDNLTGNPTQDYLSEGLTEEMISQLGRLDPAHFGVIALTSAMHYKDAENRVDQIGRELGAQYVLEGSVRKDADMLRISAQLIRVQDETYTWTRQYDRQLTGLLGLQKEIALEISDEVQVILGYSKPAAHPAAAATISLQQSEAHDLYLRGLYFFNKRTVDAFWRAIDFFKQATEKDPNYAPPYAAMANCYTLLRGYSGAPRTEYMVQARAAALRALELDEMLPEAHTALAVIVQNYDLDWTSAGREYRRAIELNPNYATAHHWYAEHLGYLGRFDEALEESERARQLDPLSLIVASDNAVLLYYARQYDQSIEKFRVVAKLDPTFARAGMIIAPYIQKGLTAEAVAQVESDAQAALRAGSDIPWTWTSLVQVYSRAGEREKARHAMDKLLAMNRANPVDPGAIARAYRAMGDNDETISWLEKALSQHSDTITALKVNPEFDPLRGDPRFQDLLRRSGLAQ